MGGKLKKILCGVLVLSLVLGGISFGECNTEVVYASVIDEAENYDLGYQYDGIMEARDYARYWKFTLSEKSYVTLFFEYSGAGYGASIYDSNGKEVLKRDDITFQTKNMISNTSSGSLSRNLSAGTYYIEIYNNGVYGYSNTWNFNFKVQAEPLILLPRGNILSLSSTGKRKIKVVCKTDRRALGYRIQYSKDVTFKKGVKTIYSESGTEIISGISSRGVYYVKICPYSVYDNGSYVFGQNSRVQKIKVK